MVQTDRSSNIVVGVIGLTQKVLSQHVCIATFHDQMCVVVTYVHVHVYNYSYEL